MHCSGISLHLSFNITNILLLAYVFSAPSYVIPGSCLAFCSFYAPSSSFTQLFILLSHPSFGWRAILIHPHPSSPHPLHPFIPPSRTHSPSFVPSSGRSSLLTHTRYEVPLSCCRVPRFDIMILTLQRFSMICSTLRVLFPLQHPQQSWILGSSPSR